MRQSGMLVMVAAPAGGAWSHAAESLLQEDHLPIDAVLAEMAWAGDGAGATLVRCLAALLRRAAGRRAGSGRRLACAAPPDLSLPGIAAGG